MSPLSELAAPLGIQTFSWHVPHDLLFFLLSSASCGTCGRASRRPSTMRTRTLSRTLPVCRTRSCCWPLGKDGQGEITVTREAESNLCLVPHLIRFLYSCFSAAVMVASASLTGAVRNTGYVQCFRLSACVCVVFISCFFPLSSSLYFSLSCSFSIFLSLPLQLSFSLPFWVSLAHLSSPSFCALLDAS